MTPLIGRDEEIALLRRRWDQAASGEGRVALISGEPGIGKSRLVAALHDCLDGEPHVRLHHFCSLYHTDSALHPFIAQLDRAASFLPADTANVKLDKLENLLPDATAEEIALLAAMLSVPVGDRCRCPICRRSARRS